MLGDNVVYDFEFNGESTGIQVSIRQALTSDDWDVITLQQASHFSGRYETLTQKDISTILLASLTYP